MRHIPPFDYVVSTMTASPTASSTPSTASLTMYTTTWCGYCSRLKTALKSEGIPYSEVDIEADPTAAEFVGSVNGGNQVVPTVKFADGSTLTNPSIKEVKAKLS